MNAESLFSALENYYVEQKHEEKEIYRKTIIYLEKIQEPWFANSVRSQELANNYWALEICQAFFLRDLYVLIILNLKT